MLGSQALQVWLEFLESKEIKDHLEQRALEVLRVRQDPQAPRVSLAVPAPLG